MAVQWVSLMDIALDYIHKVFGSALGGGAISSRAEAFNSRLERIRAGILHFGGTRLGVNALPIVY